MESIKFVKKNDVVENLEKYIKDNEIRYYCYDITRSIVNGGKINFDNITKRIEKHFKDAIDNNEYHLHCYYEKEDSIGTGFNIVFWINEYTEKNCYYTFKEKIRIRYISWGGDVKDITIEEIDETLQYINDRLVYYNKLLNNVDEIIEENNKIYDSIKEFQKKYDDGIHYDILWLMNK